MRVISLNTGRNEGHYEWRLDFMARALAEVRPEIVFLQECFASSQPLHDTARFIADKLAMKYLHQPARKKVRTVDGVSAESTSGLAILTNLPLGRDQRVNLPMTDEDGERISQIATVTVKNQSFKLANVHFTYLPGTDGEDLRIEQLRVTLAFADQLKGSDHSLILAGDLNAGPGSRLFSELARNERVDLGPDEPHRLQPTYLGRLLDTAPKNGSRVVDHIALVHPTGVRRRSSIRRRYIALNEKQRDNGHYPSDHAAVVAEIEFE